MSAKSFHGSDLEKIEKKFGIKKEDIVSFSANVNPLGVSSKLTGAISANLDCIASYPDREYTELKEKISGYCGVDSKHILVGSGATELISKTIEGINPSAVLIIEPTYSEYVKKLKENDCIINSYMLLPEMNFAFDTNVFEKLIPGNELIMICNPNNPTGNAIDVRTLLEVCKMAKRYDCKVLVDETYVEFTPDIDIYSGAKILKENSNLMILRGTSKFFGTPGLRLGYLLCANPDYIDYLKSQMDPWSVNTYAAVCAGEMFDDSMFIKECRAFVKNEMERVICELKKLPLKVYDPISNFVLLRIERDDITAKDAFLFCIKKGLMIRDCSDFKGLGNKYIRLCVNTIENNDRLILALKDLLG